MTEGPDTVNQQTIETPSSRIEKDTIKLNYNDIFIPNNNLSRVDDYSSKKDYEVEVKHHRPSKRSHAEPNPYLPLGNHLVNRNLSINILDEHSSIISYNEDSRSIKQKLGNY